MQKNSINYVVVVIFLKLKFYINTKSYFQFQKQDKPITFFKVFMSSKNKNCIKKS